MFEKLSFFQTASALSRHAALRQSVIAQNVAHADSPEYLARRVAPFAESFRADYDIKMRQTRAAHMADGDIFSSAHITESRFGVDPNGNSVSLEQEMISAAEASGEHERALALYRHGMKILRLSLGRRA